MNDSKRAMVRGLEEQARPEANELAACLSKYDFQLSDGLVGFRIVEKLTGGASRSSLCD